VTRVFDGHNDALSRLAKAGPDAAAGFLAGDTDPTSSGSTGGDGHLDLPRAQAGGLGGGCFAVFTCSPDERDYESGAYFAPVQHDRALGEALAQVALLHRLERASDGRLRVVREAADLDTDPTSSGSIRGDTDPTSSGSTGGLAAVLHVEGAEPIGPALDELEVLHAAGMRSLGLVWSRPNAYATGVPFGFPGSPDQGPGLTDAGRALVRACAELRILIDLSHLNARGFWDVAAASAAPLVASHSGAHVLCPSPRNLADDQLRAIGESGGLVGINFHVGFLRADGADDADTPLAAIAEHAAHVAEVAGVDAVALGSDFDGATMPVALRDVGGLPAVLDALAAAGFGERELERIAWGNWRRVLEATWAG
jgi:membrane dipeptidase